MASVSVVFPLLIKVSVYRAGITGENTHISVQSLSYISALSARGSPLIPKVPDNLAEYLFPSPTIIVILATFCVVI